MGCSILCGLYSVKNAADTKTNGKVDKDTIKRLFFDNAVNDIGPMEIKGNCLGIDFM